MGAGAALWTFFQLYLTRVQLQSLIALAMPSVPSDGGSPQLHSSQEEGFPRGCSLFFTAGPSVFPLLLEVPQGQAGTTKETPIGRRWQGLALPDAPGCSILSNLGGLT